MSAPYSSDVTLRSNKHFVTVVVMVCFSSWWISGKNLNPFLIVVQFCPVCFVLLFPSFSFFLWWRPGPTRARAYSFTMFLNHTQRHTTVGRTPLDEWSAGHRDTYLTARITNKRKISMSQPGFELAHSAGERPQTYALDRAPIGIFVFFTFSLLASVSFVVVCCL
jgi:hypothetical protein